MKCVLTAAALLLNFSAYAQDYNSYSRVPREAPAMSPMDCSVLSHTPYVCVRNELPVSIAGIACKGFWGTTPLSVPGGHIPPGGTAVIKFFDKCENHTLVTRSDKPNEPRDYQGFDPRINTMLNVNDQ